MPIRQKQKRTQGIDLDKPHGRDLFQTPNYAIDLLIPFIPNAITHIWECAVGDGKISNRLFKYGYSVFSSDIRQSGIVDEIFNFVIQPLRKDIYDYPMAIITNPPFSLKRLFFEKCIEYDVPFALLIPTDYCGWIIDAIQNKGCEKIIPTRRIDYITPSGLSGRTGNTSNFHSMWLTRYFNLGQTETFVELTNKEKKENI